MLLSRYTLRATYNFEEREKETIESYKYQIN